MIWKIIGAGMLLASLVGIQTGCGSEADIRRSVYRPLSEVEVTSYGASQAYFFLGEDILDGSFERFCGFSESDLLRKSERQRLAFIDQAASIDAAYEHGYYI